MRCPLCEASSQPFATVNAASYFRCRQCRLTFLDPAQRPSREEEKAQYDLHENAVDDPGYRRFLSQLSEPLQQRLPAAAKGLDFGCGPGPALAAMLAEQGHSMVVFDPLYANHPNVLNERYDFVTCTEVLEHLHRPDETWAHFNRLVKPGGWLGLMTRWLTDDAAFANWHYRRDPTHVCFWQPATFEWLARQFGWELALVGNPVVLMQKQ